MKKRLIAVFAVVGLLASTGIALAADDDSGDTVFNFGYDEENHVFVWSINPTDGLYNCAVPVDDTLTATYMVNDLIHVSDLVDSEGDPVEFAPTSEEDLSDEFDEPATEPIEYDGVVCALSGDVVAGPNGQVNHGMFMKLANSLYEGKARGCVMRYLAQSDLGKDGQQIKVADVDPDAPALETGATGDIDFESVVADCEHGKADKDDRVTGQENAAAKKAAHADHPRGKSADAPGHN